MAKSTVESFKHAVIFVSVAIVPVLVWYLFDVLLIGMGAILIAVLLQVGAEPFGWMRLPRWLSLVLSALVISCVVGGAVYLFGTGIASEFQEVLERIEEARNSIAAALQASGVGKMILLHAQSANIPVTTFIGRIFGGGISFLAGILVMVFAGVYLAAQPSLYRKGLAMLFPPRWRADADETIDYLAGALRLWLLGQLIEMVIVAVGFCRLAHRPSIASRTRSDCGCCGIRALSRTYHSFNSRDSRRCYGKPQSSTLDSVRLYTHSSG